MNKGISRAFAFAHIQSRLEPTNLIRTDGKRPDGATLTPWEKGQYLVWDATCPNSYAPSYAALASTYAGAVANNAEDRQRLKYQMLPRTYSFVPFAVETSGALGNSARRLLEAIATRVKHATGERNAYFLLLQRLSIINQVANSAAIRASMGQQQSLY